MYQYSIIQWLFFFYFYCFFGWCFESTYVSIKNKHLVNRGFMRGPFLPLYGTGAMMMLIVSMPFQNNLVLIYIAGCIGATILEYVTGVTMEALFKVRYWDYSDQKFNFQGHICLGSSLVWGILTILMTQVIHKPVEHFIMMIPNNVLTMATLALTVLIVSDFVLAFRAALDLRDILVKMQKAKEELERAQKRLDVIWAFYEEDKNAKKMERSGRIEEFVESIGERLETIKAAMQEKPSAYLDNVKEEISEIRVKYGIYLEKITQLKYFKDIRKRAIIKGNPGMVSRKFKEVLEELKDAVNEKGNKKN